MHGLKSGSCRFWLRTDLPSGTNMLRAEIQRALMRAPRQLRRLARLANSPGFKSFRCPRERIKFSLERFSDHSAAHVGESNSRSNVFQIPRASVCVPSRWKVLSGEFRRRPTALAIKFRKSDLVGRRGLSEPREDFSRLPTHAFQWLYPWLYPWLYQSLILASTRNQIGHHNPTVCQTVFTSVTA